MTVLWAVQVSCAKHTTICVRAAFTLLEVFRINFPKSLKTQQTIVQKLDALNADTKKLEAIYQQKINDLDELKKSVLQKAFNGGLN